MTPRSVRLSVLLQDSQVVPLGAIGVDPEMDIRHCARLFDKFGLGRAPVIENGLIVGIVSYTDMVRLGVRREI